jgi:nitrogen regulatory protein PII
LNDIRLLTIITKREYEYSFEEFLKSDGMTAIFSTPCQGTAVKSMLDLLGLEKTEKALMISMAERGRAERIMRGMVSQLGINMPGNGIAMTIPVSSIGGVSSMKYLMERQNMIINEVADMDDRQPVFNYDLLVAITERGCVEQVMEAARTAGARGGTIIHAKGTGNEFTAKFFGVSIASEKDVALIVVNHKDKDGIMRAIMEKAGIRSEAHTAMISLPVESVVGLTSIMSPEATEE